MLDRLEGAFAASVLAGLSATPKALEPKWFYDVRGSALFDRICTLDAYYPTRTETAILRDRAGEIAAAIGPGAVIYEPGAGSATKVRLLLAALERPVLYVPADICATPLGATAAGLRAAFPGLHVVPMPLDFTAPLTLPPAMRGAGPVTVFFPGSTIGNLEPPEARALLARFREEAGGHNLLIGVDLLKDPARLVAAYDDPEGVTAAFNKNLLARINRELGANFDLDAFRHVARFDPLSSRIEMHLESMRPQRVTVLDSRFSFDEGERICTEHAYKFTPDGFSRLARGAGWGLVRCWTDPDRLFGVFLFRNASE